MAATLITSAVLAQRLSISNNRWRCLFIAWTFLFFFLGPVFYHLQVALIIILLGFNRRYSEHQNRASSFQSSRCYWLRHGLV